MSGADGSSMAAEKPISSFSVFEFVDEAEAAATGVTIGKRAGVAAQESAANPFGASASNNVKQNSLMKGDCLDFERQDEEEDRKAEEEVEGELSLPSFVRDKKQKKRKSKLEGASEQLTGDSSIQKVPYPFELPETPATEMGKRKLRGDAPNIVPAFKSSNFLNTQFVRSFPEKEDQKLLSDAVIALDKQSAKDAGVIEGKGEVLSEVANLQRESRSAESMDGADLFLVEGKTTIFNLTETEVQAPEGPSDPEKQKRSVFCSL